MEVWLITLVLGATECGLLNQPTEVEVARIELNHIVRLSAEPDDLGRWKWTCTPAFDYWNLWGWYGFPEYDIHVQEWDSARRDHLLIRENGWYVLLAQGHKGQRYRIRSRVFVETWTVHDPERADGEVFPVNRRRRILGFRPDSTITSPLDPFMPR